MASTALVRPRLLVNAVTCPAEGAEHVADLYWLGRLSHNDAALFEEHLLACRTCVREVSRAGDFIRAFRAAAAES